MLFRSNAQTLKETLDLGAAGYSSVMANFHPELYACALKLYYAKHDLARELFDFTSLAALIENIDYPVCAKYYLQLEGLDISLSSRVLKGQSFSTTSKLQMEQLWRLTQVYKQKCQDILSVSA